MSRRRLSLPVFFGATALALTTAASTLVACSSLSGRSAEALGGAPGGGRAYTEVRELDDAQTGEEAAPEPAADAKANKPLQPMAIAPSPAPPPTGTASAYPPPAKGLKREAGGLAAVMSEPSIDGNRFAAERHNPFVDTREDALSTFAVDVDTASYALARRYLNSGALPPHQAVRIEEFVNYFKYRYPAPEQGAFAVHLEGAPSPFTPGRQIVKVGLQGKTVSKSERKRAHLVFLVDTSGSMQSADKLELVKESVKIAVKNLNEHDTVALVTYAGSTRDVLPPTPATDVATIHRAIDSLSAGGGTSMGSGMELAYTHAVKKASAHSVARVVVLTDGDTNLGPNLSADAMLKSIEKYVAEGVTMTTVGYGMGNYRDDLMERLADKGNGNCFYIDSVREARKVFEQKIAGTIEVIAKDVKVQVEFDPKVVKSYRLLGYENRDIADRDFRNDKVDAGEIGAGHSVTALYEVELTDARGDLGRVRVRAKAPNGTEAAEQQFTLGREKLARSLETASEDLRFAVAVAGTADILRGNDDAKTWSLHTAEKLAAATTRGEADREEFVSLLKNARAMVEARRTVAGR